MSELSSGQSGPEPTDQSTDQPADQSVDPSINQPIDETLDQSMDESFNQSNNHSVDESINETINESVDESTDESTEYTSQSVHQSIDQTIYQSVDHASYSLIVQRSELFTQAINQQTNQPINESLNQHMGVSFYNNSSIDYQSVNQSIDYLSISPSKNFQSLNQQMSRSLDQPIDQSINQPFPVTSNQLFDESVNRFVEQSINHSINQSLNPSIDQSMPASSFSTQSLDQSVDQSIEQRQYARKALLAVGDRIGSNVIMRYSSKLVPRAINNTINRSIVNQWSYYGDPLLNKIDAKLDEAMNAIANATTGLQAAYEYTQTPRAGSDQSIEQSPDQSFDQSLNKPINDDRVDEKSMNFSMDQSMDEQKKTVDVFGPLDQPVDQSINQETEAYWNRLKDKFVASHWYRHVDSILLQNSVVKALTSRMGSFNQSISQSVTQSIRPAEVFFNTVTEEFLTHQSQEQFLSALQQRVGPAWDDRLAPLAKGFYTTAKAVSAVVGAGKFVGGALQLGRTKANSVVEELLEQWDRVLGLGNNLVDRWLPDSQSRSSRMIQDDQSNSQSLNPSFNQSPNKSINQSIGKKRVRRRCGSRHNDDYSSDEDDHDELARKQLKSQLLFSQSINQSMDQPITQSINQPRFTEISMDSDESDDVSTSDEEDDDHESSDAEEEKTMTCFVPVNASANQSISDRTGGVLIAKVGARLRQRIPSMSIFGLTTLTVSFTSDLKNRLTDRCWFTLVDDILMQNALVKTLASLVRPAEHFFNTALQMFSTHVFKSHKPKTPHLPLPARLAELGMDDSSDDDDDFSPIQVSISTSSSQSSPILITSRAVSPSLSFTTSFTQTFTQSVQHTLNHTVPTTQLALETLADDFVYQLRVALGHSWDERLLDHARQFYHTAYEVRPNAGTVEDISNETQSCA